ncbi:MAG: ribosome silencing factor [Lachnospiraceae bacterium]|nr:ribosome silencing factor [Lachnospiraceae bacterium]
MNIIEKMTEAVVAALEDKKGEDIQLIDISEISPIADKFIIASGTNRNQVQAMADAVEENMHKAGFSLKQTEGYDSANWILMDFVDVVVHIFDKESRSFYDLERIWKDGKITDLASLRNLNN